MDDHGEMIIYQTEDGLTKIDVSMQDETVWLSQADMSKLFQTTKQNISLHINNIFKDGELDSASVVKEYLTARLPNNIPRMRMENSGTTKNKNPRCRNIRGSYENK